MADAAKERSGLWIRRYRSGISGYSETSVLYIPCAVRNLFDFRVAGQRRAVSCALRSRKVQSWEVRSGEAAKSKVPACGFGIKGLAHFVLCAFYFRAVRLRERPSRC
jgi:hypothetical protein